MEDTMFGFPVKTVDSLPGKPEKPMMIAGSIASIVPQSGHDWEHAKWLGQANWPVFFSYQMLDVIPHLPWKLVELFDEPDKQRKWFRRAE